MLGERKTLSKGSELPRGELLTLWALSFLGGHFTHSGNSSWEGSFASGRWHSQVRVWEWPFVPLGRHHPTSGSRLEREGLPRTITHVSSVPGANTELVVLVWEHRIGVKYRSLESSTIQNTSEISHCLAGFGLEQSCAWWTMEVTYSCLPDVFTPERADCSQNVVSSAHAHMWKWVEVSVIPGQWETLS